MELHRKVVKAADAHMFTFLFPVFFSFNINNSDGYFPILELEFVC